MYCMEVFVRRHVLFRAEVDDYRNTVEVPHLAHAVLYKAFVGVADILRQVAEEDKLRIGSGQLGDVFDFNPFAFDRRGRILLFDDS